MENVNGGKIAPKGLLIIASHLEFFRFAESDEQNIVLVTDVTDMRATIVKTC